MRIFACAGLMATLLATVAFSQENTFGIRVAAAGQFPSGDFDKTAGIGYGAFGGFELGGWFALTARSGYVRYLERADHTRSFIPVFGGIKLSTEDRAIYLAGEGGVVVTRIDYSGSNVLTDDVHETNPGWGLGIGSEVGPLDLRFSLNVWDAAHMPETTSLGLSLGFTLWML
jgi:hypothetical protein